MLVRTVLAFVMLTLPALAQQPAPPAMVKQDDAIVAMYQQIADAYAVGRRALSICQTEGADIARQLADARKEIEELKKSPKEPPKGH